MNEVMLKAKQTLFNMPDMSKAYINWHEEGGAEIIRVNFDWYVLFEVHQYGGNPNYYGIYHKNDLDGLINTAFSWT